MSYTRTLSFKQKRTDEIDLKNIVNFRRKMLKMNVNAFSRIN